MREARLSATTVAGYALIVGLSFLAFMVSVAPVKGALQDFSVAASPGNVTVLAGSTGQSTITITGTNGFTGTVNLTATVSPSTSLSCSLAPTSVSISLVAPSGTSTLSCTGPAGAYTVSVTGTSSALSHSSNVTFTVQDFDVSASPNSVTVNAGVNGNSTVTVTGLEGFTGTVLLSYTISPSTGMSCNLNPTSVTLNSTTASLSSILSCSGQAGDYNVTIVGDSSGLSHSAKVGFTVQDFTLTASPASIAANAGGTASSVIIVAPVNGFTGTVTLNSTSSPPGLPCTFNPANIVLGASQNSTLSCTGTSAATFTVTVVGSSGSLTRTTIVVVKVRDFTVAFSPGSITALSGESGNSTVTLTGQYGFTGNVFLIVAVSPSPGPTCTLFPNIVGLNATATTGASTLSCVGPRGTYTVTVSSGSNGLLRPANVALTVEDFTVIASPSRIVLPAGTSGTSTISVIGLNGFDGSVDLSFRVNATGLSCTLTQVILAGSGASVLSCGGSTGAYNVTVTGKSRALAHSVSVIIVQELVKG